MILKNYTVLSTLDQSGISNVYLGEHELLHYKVAIKEMRQEFVLDQELRKRFLNGARRLARMSHPNIVRVTDLFDDGDTVAFVMEYAEGESLDQYLTRKGRLKDEEIIRLFSQILDAAGYLHSHSLIHKGIKPTNLIVDADGKIKLLDFGISKTLDDGYNSHQAATSLNQKKSDSRYMSPEQISNPGDLTTQSDIYSLGVVLWQLVTGSMPYPEEGISDFEIQTRILNGEPLVTHTLWDEIILKAMCKEKNGRFKTVDEIKEAIRSMNEPTVQEVIPPVLPEKDIPKLVKEDLTEIIPAVTLDDKTVVSTHETQTEDKTQIELDKKVTPQFPANRPFPKAVWIIPAIVFSLYFIYNYSSGPVSYDEFETTEATADDPVYEAEAPPAEAPATEMSGTVGDMPEAGMEDWSEDPSVETPVTYNTVCPICGFETNESQTNVYLECQACGSTFYVCKPKKSEAFGIPVEWLNDQECDCQDCSDE